MSDFLNWAGEKEPLTCHSIQNPSNWVNWANLPKRRSVQFSALFRQLTCCFFQKFSYADTAFLPKFLRELFSRLSQQAHRNCESLTTMLSDIMDLFWWKVSKRNNWKDFIFGFGSEQLSCFLHLVTVQSVIKVRWVWQMEYTHIEAGSHRTCDMTY